MSKTTETPFVTELKKNIRDYVRAAKRDGTVGMSVDNLRQCVFTPKALEGAPRGTNAPYFYAQIFRETLAGMSFTNFQILN